MNLKHATRCFVHIPRVVTHRLAVQAAVRKATYNHWGCRRKHAPLNHPRWCGHRDTGRPLHSLGVRRQACTNLPGLHRGCSGKHTPTLNYPRWCCLRPPFLQRPGALTTPGGAAASMHFLPGPLPGVQRQAYTILTTPGGTASACCSSKGRRPAPHLGVQQQACT